MINVLITGAGSVLGQSIFKALAFSSYVSQLNVFFTNSEPYGAAFLFNSRDLYKLKVKKSYLVPLAKDSQYLSVIEKICDQEHIDLIFCGTEHEIFKIAALMTKAGYEKKIASQPLNIVNITTDKWETATFFQRHQIDAPSTTLYSHIKDWLPGRNSPFIMKPRISSASRNVHIINKPKDFETYRFDTPEQIIVQEMIGTIDDEYTIGCYVDRIDGSFHSISMKRRLSKDGASISGVVVNDSEITAYCNEIIDALKKEGLVWGPINIQLRYRNKPLAFEINGRFSSTEVVRAKFGFNAVEAAISNLVFNEPYKNFEPEYGSGFLRYYEELFYKKDDENFPIIIKP